MITDSQCAKDQEGSEVGADDHVEVVLVEDVDEVADKEQDYAGDEDGEDVADQGTAKADSHLDPLVRSKLSFAHHEALHYIFCQIFGTGVREVSLFQFH